MPRKRKSNLGPKCRKNYLRKKALKKAAQRVCADGFIHQTFHRPTLIDSFVKELAIKRPFCTVCMRIQTSEEQAESENVTNNNSDSDDDYRSARPLSNGKKWVSTSENTPVSHSPVLFKLNDILDIEFNNGNICDNCNQFVDELDAMQSHLASLKQTLSDRVDKYYNKNSIYEVDHELVAHTLEGTNQSGEAFIQKAKAVTGTDIDATLVPFPTLRPFIALTRQKSLALKEEEGELGSELPTAVRSGFGKSVPNNIWEKWMGGRHVENVLMRGNFDYNFTIKSVRNPMTHRSKVVLTYQGHKYMKFRVPMRRSYPEYEFINPWICMSKGCPATLVTTLDNICLLLDSMEIEHNHGIVESPAMEENINQNSFVLKSSAKQHNAQSETSMLQSDNLLEWKPCKTEIDCNFAKEEASQIFRSEKWTVNKSEDSTSHIRFQKYVQEALLKRHFDHNFVINSVRDAISHRSKDVLTYQMHQFVKYPSPKACPVGDLVNRWVCRSKGCPAILVTTSDNACLFLDSTESEHNHGVDKDSLQTILM